MRQKSLAFAIIAAVVFSPSVRAQDALPNVYLLDGGAFTNALMANSLKQRMEWSQRAILGNSAQESVTRVNRSQSKPKPISLAFKSNPSVSVAASLAGAYPPEQREEAKTLFTNLLTLFHKIEQKFDQPKNDLPTAIAGFIAGSYTGYHRQDFPDAKFVPLVKQIRAILATNPKFATLSNRQKQELYEQFALLGMLTAGTHEALKQNPNPTLAANLKKASGTYLRTFLKVDPDQISFSDRGMTFTAFNQ